MNIKHEDYKDVLFNNKQMQHTMKTIRSKNHQLGMSLTKCHYLASTTKIHIGRYEFLCLLSSQNLKRCDVTTQLWQSSY